MYVCQRLDYVIYKSRNLFDPKDLSKSSELDHKLYVPLKMEAKRLFNRKYVSCDFFIIMRVYNNLVDEDGKNGTKLQGLGRRGTRLYSETSQLAPKKPSTKELLIGAGEQLFGRHGFDGISLREIAAAAGQANKNVVQYHFTDKSGLVRAIIEERAKQIEVFRSERLQKLKQDDPHYSRELLKTLWLPSMAIQSTDGDHTFCRFLLQLMLQPHITGLPFYKFYTASKGDRSIADLPSVMQAMQLFLAHFKDLPIPTMSKRLVALYTMFLSTIVEYDNARALDKSSVPNEFDVEPILDMCLAALTVPPRRA